MGTILGLLPKLLGGGLGIGAKVEIAAVGAVAAGAVLFFVFHAGEEAEVGKSATAEIEQVQDDLKLRDRIDDQVRDAGRDGGVDDLLQPFYRDSDGD